MINGKVNSVECSSLIASVAVKELEYLYNYIFSLNFDLEIMNETCQIQGRQRRHWTVKLRIFIQRSTIFQYIRIMASKSGHR